MRRLTLTAALVGLAVAIAASWSIWTLAGIGDQDLRFALSLAPLLLWALALIALLLAAKGAPTAAQLSAQHKRELLSFLATSGLGGRRGRYRLPFYLVVGPPGSGKTSILESSEQQFGEPAVIGNTVWRAGRQAVFIETTAGVPDAPLAEVVALLKAIRPRLPLNGTLLVLSPADLVLADQIEQRAIAQTVAKNLRELDQLVQQRLPVYLLLAKTDLVPGFREFFDRYETQERNQPWGFSLTDETRADRSVEGWREAEIEKGFHDIVAAMRLRHIEWLTRETDPVRNAHLQGFAAQIAALRETIAPFTDALLNEKSRVDSSRLLRGIFLTSARQEVLAIDALLPELSRRFAMPRIGLLPPDLGLDDIDHSYFVNGTLEKVIIPEAGLVTRGDGAKLRRIAQWTAVAVLSLAGVWAGYRMFADFDRSIATAARLSEAVTSSPRVATAVRRGDLPNVLAVLQQLETLKATLPVTPAALFRVGLSDNRNLGAEIEEARRMIRARALMPHLSALFEADLVDLSADAVALKRLLAIADAPADADLPALKTWLERRAKAIVPQEPDLMISEALAAIGEAGGGLSIGPDYVDAAKQLLTYRESTP